MGDAHKALDHNRIKLSVAGLDQAAHGLFERQALPVGPGRDHGVKGIDHRNDARPNWDLISLQSPRIAGAIVALVVMQYVETCSLETRKEPSHRPAVFGVLLHERVLFYGKTTRLSQDRVGNSDLPDVMEQRGNFNILEDAFFHAELLSDAHGPFGKPGTVVSGVEVLQIQELVEGAD